MLVFQTERQNYQTHFEYEADVLPGSIYHSELEKSMKNVETANH